MNDKIDQKKERKYGYLIAILAIFLICISIIVIFFTKDKSDTNDILFGNWNLDDVTEYYFDGKGNGSLNLPGKAYSFTYEIKDDELSIDFENENARDITYKFVINENKLTIISDENNETIKYLLTKKND